MKKIRISSNWDNSKNLTERLKSQFLEKESDIQNIEFVYDDSYDIIVFFNHITHQIKNGSKSFIFPHEPSWSGTHQKNIPENTTIFGFDNNNYNRNCLESQSYTFYGGRGPWIDTLDFWSFNNLVDYNFNKTKLLSSSITKLNSTYGSTCLYEKRFNLLNNIKNKDFIDFYGFGQSSPKRKDSLENYMFNISIENSLEKNWITEKFYDNILCETIPIYFGCKNIKEIYPEDGYILLERIDDFDYINSILLEVKNNYNEIYNQKIEGFRKIKKRYLTENNLLKKIIQL
jgi:hypothetical protein